MLPFVSRARFAAAFRTVLRALLLVAAAQAFVASSARAHEGHSHGEEPLPTVSTAPRGHASSPMFELVVVASGPELIVYLDRFATNEPVEGATIEAETPQGQAVAKADAGGRYRISAPWVAKPGHHDLIFTVSVDGEVDVLPVALDVPESKSDTAAPRSFLGLKLTSFTERPTLVLSGAAFAVGLILGALLLGRRKVVAATAASLVLILFAAQPSAAHEGHDHPPEAGASAAQNGERAQRLPDGTVFAPKPIQRLFAVRTQVAERARHRPAVELPGRIIPDPSYSGYVQSSVGGRISPPPGGFRRLGSKVAEGEVLAYVTPPLQAIDISDMRQRQGELDQQISIVERRLARQSQLAPSGAVSRAQLEETQLELAGLRERRASLESVRREPEALLAPVTGVIADGMPYAGQIIAQGGIVFTIVDPGRLWVEALSFEAYAGAQDASATTAGGKRLKLAFRGSGFSDRSQSIPVHFAIEADAGGLRAGQFVTVVAPNGEERVGLAVPRASVIRSANGQDFVYEHVSPERFEARPVRIEPLDAERVLVAAGVEPGRRIVVQGAELLHHVR